MPHSVGSKKHPGTRGKSVRQEDAALTAFGSLLRADRCVFEASEAVKGASLPEEHVALEEIRELIAKNLKCLQQRAYKAMRREK